MLRSDILMRALNKGIKDEDAQLLMSKPVWSPNNLRALIISKDKIVIRYHCVGNNTKYSKLLEVCDTSRGNFDEEREIFSSWHNKGKIRTVLSPLIENRIYSSIEEIIWCLEGYPPDIFEFEWENVFNSIGDARLSGETVKEKLRNRFVRLDNLTAVNLNIQQFAVGVDLNVKVRTDHWLISDGIFENSIPVYKQVKFDEGPEWWKGTFNRSKNYAFDADGLTLDRHLTGIKDYFLAKEKNDKLAELDSKNIEEANRKRQEIVEKYEKKIEVLLSYVLEENKKIIETMSKLDEESKRSWGDKYCGRAIVALLRNIFGIGFREKLSKIDIAELSEIYEIPDFNKYIVDFYIKILSKVRFLEGKNIGNSSDAKISLKGNALAEASDVLIQLLNLSQLFCLLSAYYIYLDYTYGAGKTTIGIEIQSSKVQDVMRNIGISGVKYQERFTNLLNTTKAGFEIDLVERRIKSLDNFISVVESVSNEDVHETTINLLEVMGRLAAHEWSK
jgi:hypothetical protein